MMNVAVPRNQAAVRREIASQHQLQGQPLVFQARDEQNQMTVAQQQLQGAIEASQPLHGARVNAVLSVGSQYSRHKGLGSSYVTGAQPEIPGPGVSQRQLKSSNRLPGSVGALFHRGPNDETKRDANRAYLRPVVSQHTGARLVVPVDEKGIAIPPRVGDLVTDARYRNMLATNARNGVSDLPGTFARNKYVGTTMVGGNMDAQVFETKNGFDNSSIPFNEPGSLSATRPVYPRMTPNETMIKETGWEVENSKPAHRNMSDILSTDVSVRRQLTNYATGMGGVQTVQTLKEQLSDDLVPTKGYTIAVDKPGVQNYTITQGGRARSGNRARMQSGIVAVPAQGGQVLQLGSQGEALSAQPDRGTLMQSGYYTAPPGAMRRDLSVLPSDLLLDKRYEGYVEYEGYEGPDGLRVPDTRQRQGGPQAKFKDTGIANRDSPIMLEQVKSMKDVQGTSRQEPRWDGVYSTKNAPYGDKVNAMGHKQNSRQLQGPDYLALRRTNPDGTREKTLLDESMQHGPSGVGQVVLNSKGGSGSRPYMQPEVMQNLSMRQLNTLRAPARDIVRT